MRSCIPTGLPSTTTTKYSRQASASTLPRPRQIARRHLASHQHCSRSNEGRPDGPGRGQQDSEPGDVIQRRCYLSPYRFDDPFVVGIDGRVMVRLTICGARRRVLNHAPFIRIGRLERSRRPTTDRRQAQRPPRERDRTWLRPSCSHSGRTERISSRRRTSSGEKNFRRSVSTRANSFGVSQARHCQRSPATRLPSADACAAPVDTDVYPSVTIDPGALGHDSSRRSSSPANTRNTTPRSRSVINRQCCFTHSQNICEAKTSRFHAAR